MMNPLKFLTLAKELLDSNSESEAKLRTSIGRSYYAVFLFAAQKYAQLHKREEYIEDIIRRHSQFLQMLKDDDNSDLRAMSRWLGTLKYDREKADYYMKAKITLNSAQSSYNKAERLKNFIDEKFESS